jgi:hypothetical protein
MAFDQIRKVGLYWCEPSAPTYHLVPTNEVETFVKATKELHWRPGINPHVKDRDPAASKIWKITSAPLELKGPFWWTVPGLGKNDDPNGAHIIDGWDEEILFIDRHYIAKCEADAAEENAAALRQRERELATDAVLGRDC